MFGRPPPWGRDPLPDMHSLLSSRTRHRHTHTRLPSLLQARGLPTCTHHLPRQHSHEPQRPKHPSFNDIPTPSSTTSSDSDCGFDTYSLDDEPNDDDDDELNVPHHHHHHRFTTPRERTRPPPHRTPDVQRTSVNLPRRTATSLRSDDLLLLPPLTHVRIRILTRAPYAAWDEELRAAVPDTMRVRDVVGGVVATYFGEG
ncbi:hypothetical protein EKO04_006965 [Ascochyta lentis]|uniref:Uncharacterized protein n=1 Tax=Ascochyta lentis TaxID=205686 RepID=A0A8H7J177_9PLEO|nr:hypothetical protein EKO04_006965 [Ascochyta lentis]